MLAVAHDLGIVGSHARQDIHECFADFVAVVFGPPVLGFVRSWAQDRVEIVVAQRDQFGDFAGAPDAGEDFGAVGAEGLWAEGACCA